MISIFQEDKLLEFKIIKEELRRIVPSGMNPDEFLLVGARYIKLWQFLIFFDDKYEGYFRTTPVSLILALDEEIIDSCFIPYTHYLAIVTNLNNIHVMKMDVHLQILKIEIPPLGFETEETAFLVSCLCPVENGYAISF